MDRLDEMAFDFLRKLASQPFQPNPWETLLFSVPSELEADVNCKFVTNCKTEGITLSRDLSYNRLTAVYK